jgi:pyruvate ferredoxin oxidoreductase alpha subunit
MPGKKIFISGDEAVAEAVRMARPHVISAYPITPQTVTVERISDFVEDGSLKSEYLHVESEHSAMSAAIGAAAVGARTFTATSSQGLLYMAETLPYASGARFPIVMMNANRTVATPWALLSDHRDSLSQLDSGWMQVYCEDAQEAFDMILQAYRIAEDPRVMSPVMVNLDGFILTHTYEMVDLPDQEEVDAFLPPYRTENRMDLEEPRTVCYASLDEYMEFHMKQEFDMRKARAVIAEVDRDFGIRFGRQYGGLLEKYRCEDADAVIVTLGSVTGTVRSVIDSMRGNGYRVGLVKMRFVRPFPEDEVVDIAEKVKAIGVLDRDLSIGYEGIVFSNVSSSVLRSCSTPAMVNYIGGLGGRNISKDNIHEMFLELLRAADGEKGKRVRFVNVGSEYDG